MESLYLQDAILPRKNADNHRMTLWWRPVVLMASISLVWWTVSKGRGGVGSSLNRPDKREELSCVLQAFNTRNFNNLNARFSPTGGAA